MQQRVAEARNFVAAEKRRHPLVPVEAVDRVSASVSAVLGAVLVDDGLAEVRTRLKDAVEASANPEAHSGFTRAHVRNFAACLCDGLCAIFRPDECKWDPDAVHVVRLWGGGTLVAVENHADRLAVLFRGVPHFVNADDPARLVDQDGEVVAAVTSVEPTALSLSVITT